MDLALLLITVLLGQEVAGLELLRINVPPYSLRGKSALLECRYDLQEDKLYSITWYKDHEEFYRYVPRGEPPQHSYRVEGVKVDHGRSDHQQVLLQNVSLHSSGQYRCEVSAEAPSFHSVSAEASMEVVVLPQEGPTITGEEKVYASGDVLSLNCTSGKSRPAANLKWFINGAQNWRRTRSVACSFQVKPDTKMVFDHHGLYSVISSLRLDLEPNHITGDKINVRCEATVELDSNSDAPLIETRTTEVFVEGQASVATPSVYLTLATALILRLASLA
ncbi:cell adhesion molecule 3-like isoform X1 [Osmia bicornis bicornis]|uniref:cell adhesion molecule 3-like isoform X1 n=1 Tax=Osmia bicornis bicornis TaxID=1437191 RepID=UPI0010F56033|nr:cell adhesion molecule 3-like isoform X1 [Osmia bicornis bicornis]XP_029041878.1 cell adhesion molecule 3-like isoform X1 [Osmia bicornis bicornis]XP_029041879.1 cell adhesion molecule 3-like isoform X1 [Osmia bicornis bicornis]XP_029041880.1 cell adhesion molecule 3-like isoform X1 [Osmia bicornis bicornis]XP_029041882.1 cell adhesion molecule 3-like isoform X1 [Osmia bicornis bicornis]XP_029041883.1 cell adhesion molecule 3-like isoform X1 [Osmia bicornis bicornis]